MPAFDGDIIVVGDRLFEQNSGAVTVLRLYSNRILIAVPGRGSRSYSYGGVLAGSTRKTLFWHDPQVLIPRKDPDAWALQRSTLRQMMELQSQFISGAHYVGVDEDQDVHDVLKGTAPHVDVTVLNGAAVPGD